MINIEKIMKECNDILQEERKIKYCCVPVEHNISCDGNIMKAHSISVCLGFNLIKNSRNEVYHFPAFGNMYSLDRAAGIYEVEPINIKSASTASMFCQKHDLELFKPIENGDFKLNNENCFLLAYRSVCLEYFKVNGKSGIHDYKVNDIATLKAYVDNILLTNNFDDFEHYIFELNDNKLLTSSVMTPTHNFSGMEIQDVNTPESLKAVVINSIRYKDKGFLIFSFKKEDRNLFIEKYFNDLLRKDRNFQSKVLTNYMFFMFENIYWNISWWDNLPSKIRKKLLEYIQPLNNMETLIKGGKNFMKDSRKDSQPAFYISKGYLLSSLSK